MNIFFSDLDNTLIFSHRHRLTERRFTAEYLDGKEQSFVSGAALDSLKEFCRRRDCLFVPVTTRTPAQYERLLPLRTALGYRYALVCNGALLFEDGVSDRAWEADSAVLCREYEGTMQEIYRALERFFGSRHLHIIEPYMVYIKAEIPPEALAEYRAGYGRRGIVCVYSSGKLFFIPEVLSKGNAVRRFLARYFSGLAVNTIAAGDSELDDTMLSECGYSFRCSGEMEYSEKLCREVLKISAGGRNI